MHQQLWCVYLVASGSKFAGCVHDEAFGACVVMKVVRTLSRSHTSYAEIRVDKRHTQVFNAVHRSACASTTRWSCITGAVLQAILTMHPLANDVVCAHCAVWCTFGWWLKMWRAFMIHISLGRVDNTTTHKHPASTIGSILEPRSTSD